MGAATLLLLTAINFSAVSSEAIKWFPSDYFDGRLRTGLQREVLEHWPGPSELARLWNNGELSEDDRVVLLVGAAAFHDPQLISLYRQAMTSESQRIRQAAVYGYRDLLADQLPKVNIVINDGSAELLAEEMLWVERTLRQRTMVELWLQAILGAEEKEFPGWRGVRFRRSASVCFRALERLVEIEDLDLLVTGYELSDNLSAKINIIKLIEALTLSRFIEMPTGEKKGWGPKVFSNAMRRFENTLPRWSEGSCTVDGKAALLHSLQIMGVSGVDPLTREHCRLWVNVLDKGLPRWWMIAARKLYACGGPWYELSALSPDSERNGDLRNKLLQVWRPN